MNNNIQGITLEKFNVELFGKLEDGTILPVYSANGCSVTKEYIGATGMTPEERKEKLYLKIEPIGVTSNRFFPTYSHSPYYLCGT